MSSRFGMAIDRYQRLRRIIDEWVLSEQEGDTPIDAYITSTVVDNMTSAAMVVLDESRDTQDWLKQEGYLKS